MSVPGVSITIDCHDPRRLVPFWCAALNYMPEPPPGGHTSWLGYWRSIGIQDSDLAGVDPSTCDSIVDPEGRRPRIWFQVVPERKAAKNRVHLDLDVTRGRQGTLAERRRVVEVEVARLISLGAERVRSLEPSGADYFAVTMVDPEGNEFCVS